MRFSLILALSLVALPAFGQGVLLGNDSLEAAGGEIVFYPRMQDDEAFGVVLDVPDEYVNYQICRVLLWIGPHQFNVFTIRIHEANEDNTRGDIVWISDLDAFQIFGSQNQISSVDLRGYGILSDVRRLRVDFFHVPGFPAPPGIASDTDGLAGPRRNWIRFFQRNGRWWDGPVDDLNLEDPLYPQPPGDWILRVSIVQIGEFCPDPQDPLETPPDAAPLPPPRDAAPPIPDLAYDEGPKPDKDPIVDALRVLDPDYAPPPIPDMARIPDPDMAPPIIPDMAPPIDRDRGAPGFVRGLKLDEVHPPAGPPDANQDVVILGDGFPIGERPDVRLGEVRLLEVEVKSSSTMLAIVPAGMPTGTYELMVERSDGHTALLPNAYTVGTDLTLESVEPTSLARGVTGTLTFVGNGFGTNTTFTVGGALIANLTIESDGRAQGDLETTLAPGTYDVEVHRGTEGRVLQDAFTVLDGPDGAAGSSGCSTVPTAPDAPLWLLIPFLVRRRLR